MDQIINTLITGVGMPAVGFVFAWLLLRHYFRRDEKNDVVAATLSELTSKIGELRETQLVSARTYAHLDAETTKQTELLRDVRSALNELNKKIHFGNVAISKGYMTPEQVRDVLSSESED